MSFLLAVSPILLAALSPASGQCEPPSGWEQVLSDEQIRWIVIGETYGTKEIPELFLDTICATAGKRRLIIAVDQPASDQSAIDAFTTSDGGPEATRAFLAASMWNGQLKDGRSSQANFRMFEDLRRMRRAGQISAVVALRPSVREASPSPDDYEKAMADLLIENSQPGATVLALVGKEHAIRSKVPWQPGYTAMAGHLPPNATLTLDVQGEGGDAWICLGGQECGATPRNTLLPNRGRGVELNEANDDLYSGVIYLGAPTSASPPQQLATSGD
jgi:hypothetical protein